MHDILLWCLRSWVHGGPPPVPPPARDIAAAAAEAHRHRVLPFLALSLDKAGLTDGLPDGTRRALRESVRRAAWENLVKRKEFQTLARLFAKERIPLAPLKGIALTALVYGDDPLRQMSDIDILIRPEDLEKVSTLLAREGFAPSERVNRAQSAMSDNGRRDWRRGDLIVDVQWRPLFFAGGRYAAFEAPRALRLSPEDHARYLCLQNLDDIERRYVFLLQMLDLALLLKRHAIPLERVLGERTAGWPPEARREARVLLALTEKTLLRGEEGSGPLWAAVLRGPREPDPIVGLRRLKTARSSRERAVFVLQYFLPDLAHLRRLGGRGGPALGYLRHWKRLLSKAARILYPI